MVIQRLQNLYLLIAVVLLAIFASTAAMTITTGSEVVRLGVFRQVANSQSQPDFLFMSMDALVVILTVIAISSYKSLRAQMRLCAICIALTLAMLLCMAVMFFVMRSSSAVTLCWGALLPVVAFVFFFLAYRGMARDKKLLSSSDRLR